MNSTRKAWVVATGIGAVEALKDQFGLCRWNYGIQLLQQHAKTNLRSYTTQSSNKLSSKLISKDKIREQKLKQSEESLRTVMYLSCWGIN